MSTFCSFDGGSVGGGGDAVHAGLTENIFAGSLMDLPLHKRFFNLRKTN